MQYKEIVKLSFVCKAQCYLLAAKENNNSLQRGVRGVGVRGVRVRGVRGVGQLTTTFLNNLQ